MTSRYRPWRDRKTKLIHAFDSEWNVEARDVRTLCGELVFIDYEYPWGTKRKELQHIPDPKKRSYDLPKLSTRLTCLSCIALR